MYGIHQELAREHQAELLRAAENHRLALQVRQGAERKARFSGFLAHVRRRRLRQHPAPAV